MTPLLQRLQESRMVAARRVRYYIEHEAAGDVLDYHEENMRDEAEEEMKRLGVLIEEEDRRIQEERDNNIAWNASIEKRGGSRNGVMNMSNAEVRYNESLPEGRGFVHLPGAKESATLGDFGEHMRSVLLGVESRVQSEGVTTEGGFLVPTIYAAPVLDLAVNAMKVRAAGASVIPMESNITKVGRLDSDPVPSWRAESAAIGESSAVFGQVTLTAKALAVHVKVSLELMEDDPNGFGVTLGNSLARAFALEADRAALYGSGSNTPLGLKGQSGVTITNFTGVNGGTLTNATAYASGGIGGAVGRLKTKNYEPSAFIYSPRTEQQLGLLVGSDLQPLQMPAYIRDAAPHLVSSQVPNNITLGTSTDTSDLILGDFSFMLIGMRTEFRVIPVHDAFLVSAGQVAFVGWMRMDVTLARAAAFEILNGLRA
jgi:HK97 family phage major capsid protein